MTNIAQRFIQFAHQYQVLQFGEFTLKSGRISPYFFNAGLFNDGQAMALLGQLYAEKIVSEKIEFDLLFGPAYKGIPLVVSIGIALAEHHQINKPIAFNRKQAKAYGDGGQLVGAPIKGKILLIDDVITAGTAIRESQALMQNQDGEITTVMVALDRQERGQGEHSTIQELQAQHIDVHSLAKLEDIIQYLKNQDNLSILSAIESYQAEYGA